MSQETPEVVVTAQGQAPANDRADRVRSILLSLRVLIRAVQDYSRWVESQCGLTSAQLWALWELFATPGMKVSDLAAALYVHQSTASNMLDKLELRGLVERRRGGPDQRVVRLYLSSAGVDLLATAPRPAQGALNAALQQLPDATLRRLSTDLETLVAALQFKDPKAALKPLP
jgi:DNA-binding MarR family transcriptional regulator